MQIATLMNQLCVLVHWENQGHRHEQKQRVTPTAQTLPSFSTFYLILVFVNDCLCLGLFCMCSCVESKCGQIIHGHVCAHTCVGQWSTLGIFANNYPTLYVWDGLSLNLEPNSLLDCLDSMAPGIFLSLPAPVLGWRTGALPWHPFIHGCWGHTNSSLHGCISPACLFS